MIRSVTRWCVLGLTVCWMNDASALGQTLPRHTVSRHAMTPVSSRAPAEHGELYGVVRDAAGQPLGGAVVSAHGASFVFQISDRYGRFSFRGLAPGAYLVRAHRDGYVPPRGRYVQVNAGGRAGWTIAMPRVPTEGDPALLEAGVGGSVPAIVTEAGEETEMAWRLRRLQRGVLKEAQAQVLDKSDRELESLLGRAAGSPARLAAALFADLSLNGQINLLTMTSFDRPQDLFSTNPGPRRPVANMSLVAPAVDGEWAVQGAVTQGEISSWILAGSYTRHASAAHRYAAGFSYSTQQYEGGNVEALAATSDGSRNVGEFYVSDIWTIAPQWTVAAGGRYAGYGYLQDGDLLSGHLMVEFQPSPDDPLRVRVSAAHREIAPGAEEFVPPATGPWLPPERTFSELARGVLTPERVDHVEIAGEHDVRGAVVSLRAFRQQIGDQLVTVFGVAGAPSGLGHYYVSSGGDFENYGWGAGLRLPMGVVQTSVDYTQVDTHRRGGLANEALFLEVAPALLRTAERVHDVTATVNTRVPLTATRLLMVYKLNNSFAADTDAAVAARFEVQVNQEMPFLNFTGARWEMLAEVRNLFRSDLFDGSIYDELLVVRPPKRVVGGVTVRF